MSPTQLTLLRQSAAAASIRGSGLTGTIARAPFARAAIASPPTVNKVRYISAESVKGPSGPEVSLPNVA